MLSRLVAAVAVAVFTVAGLASQASAFSEPIPTKISLLKWAGSPPAGKLYKIVSKPSAGLFQIPDGVSDPAAKGGKLTVTVGDKALECNLAAGSNWKGLGSPAGAKGWKYVNKAAPTGDPCKTAIIKEKVIKVLAKSVGDIDPPGGPGENPEVRASLHAGTDHYCALAVPTHFKEKEGTLIKMKSQPEPPAGCGNNCIDGIEQCDGTDADECPGLCLPNCTCPEPICNNGSKEVGEECDPAGGTADCGAGEVCGGFCECVPDVACNCGTPAPTMYMYRNAAPDFEGEVCGTTDGGTLTELECMGLYIGGGGGALPVPNMVPDQATTKFNVDQCVGTDITKAPTSPAEVGPRHCSEGKRCVGGDNDGQPCIRDKQCPLGLCKPQCWYGSYLTILNTALPLISTCISNEIVEDVTGGLDCATGRAFSRIPLDAVVHLTLGDQSPSTPGHNACPICVGGTLDVPASGICEGGTNNGLPCMPMSKSYDLYDCCAAGLNDSKPCTDNTDCPGSACVPGCSMYPTSLDCPPNPLAALGSGLLLTLQMNTEGVEAYKNTAVADAGGDFCGWCRDIEVEGSGCFEGHPDEGPPPGTKNCPDSAVIDCRPETFHSDPPVGGNDADMVDCRDGLPCRTDADCTAPYETCSQRNPGAWRDATIRTVTYDGATRPGDLRDKLPHASTVVTNFCIPPNFDDVIDGDSDLGGPGGLSLKGTAKLSPSGAFMDVMTGLLD